MSIPHAPRVTSEDKAGLYLHIPFCTARCPYCDFASRVDREPLRAHYVDALIREMALYCAGAPVFDTVYLGGGTPSLLAAEQLERVFASIAERFTFDRDTRVYLEANPEHVTTSNIELWRAVGVGTLSLGVQSFDDDELRALGRAHSSDQARRAAELALAAGFDTVSIDLIYGLPGQTLKGWGRTIERTRALGPNHLSCYQLTVHEKTVFGRRREHGELREHSESAQADFFFATHESLAAAGYRAYEVSSFARGSNHQSRHNRKYWDHAPYLGLGAAAHSFRDHKRWWNERNILSYIKSIDNNEDPVVGRETLSNRELAREAIMLGLRTTRGIDLDSVEKRFGIGLLVKNEERLSFWEDEGLLVRQGSCICPTLRGLALADRLALDFEV